MRATAFLFALLIAAQTPSAQTEWREHSDHAEVSYDVLSVQSRASFGVASVFGPSYGYSTSRLFSAHLLSARVPVSSRVTLLAELPVVYRDYDISAEDAAYFDQLIAEDGSASVELRQTSSQVSVGNPMVGAEVALGSAVRLDASLRVRSQQSTDGIGDWASHRAADVVGRVIESERTEAYQTGVTSLTLGASGRLGLPAGLSLTGRVAPVLSVLDRDVLATLDPTGSQPATTLSVRMGAFVRGRVGPVALGLGAVGHIVPPEGRDAFESGRDSGTGVLQVALEGLPVRPGLQYRAGVFSGRNAERVLSLSLDVPLR